MSKLLRRSIALGAIAAGVCLLYTYGLSETAKTGIKTAAQSVKAAYDQISKTIAQAQGQVMSGEGPLPNQQSTAQQWENLGF